jgi:hypothetical protein
MVDRILVSVAGVSGGFFLVPLGGDWIGWIAWPFMGLFYGMV